MNFQTASLDFFNNLNKSGQLITQQNMFTCPHKTAFPWPNALVCREVTREAMRALPLQCTHKEVPCSRAHEEIRLWHFATQVRRLLPTQNRELHGLLHRHGVKSYLCHFKHLLVSSPATCSYSSLACYFDELFLRTVSHFSSIVSLLLTLLVPPQNHSDCFSIKTSPRKVEPRHSLTIVNPACCWLNISILSSFAEILYF